MFEKYAQMYKNPSNFKGVWAIFIVKWGYLCANELNLMRYAFCNPT